MKIKNFNQGFIIAVIGSLVGIGGLFISYFIWGDASEAKLTSLLSYIPPLILIYLLYRVFQRDIDFGINGNTAKIYFTKGWYLFVTSGIILGLGLLSLKKEMMVVPKVSTVLIHLGICLSTGLFEELLCRGFSQNILVEGAIRDRKDPWKGIFTASLIFGLIHLIRLINNPELLITTITQGIYAFGIGLFLGVLYFKYKNLLVVILLHATFNFLGLFIGIITKPGNITGDIPISSAILQLVIILPLAFIARKMYIRDPIK
ncbi:MAG: CPBP family intramembrane metalloprotease [Tissierellia bacterium]|nr:CPBP family intramembrane metalloprotease [Tissierellia bacterium]